MRRQLTNLAMTLPAALIAMPAFAQTPADRLDHWHYGWGWGHMIFGSVMMIVFWGGIILAIVLAVRWLGGDSGRAAGSQLRPGGHLAILHERFARGEIDKDEYEERKRLLSN